MGFCGHTFLFASIFLPCFDDFLSLLGYLKKKIISLILTLCSFISMYLITEYSLSAKSFLSSRQRVFHVMYVWVYLLFHFSGSFLQGHLLSLCWIIFLSFPSNFFYHFFHCYLYLLWLSWAFSVTIIWFLSSLPFLADSNLYINSVMMLFWSSIYFLKHAISLIILLYCTVILCLNSYFIELTVLLQSSIA